MRKEKEEKHNMGHNRAKGFWMAAVVAKKRIKITDHRLGVII